MKKIIRYVLAAVIAVTGATAVNAQYATQPGQVYYLYTGGNIGRPIEWKPAVKTEQRYVIGISPLQLFNYGLKVNFEMELNVPGEWVQFELNGHWTPWYDNNSRYYYDSGWSSFVSGFDSFQRIVGAGIALGYKHIFSSSGWYINPVASFNFYSISYHDYDYVASKPDVDGFVYYTYERMMRNTKFYKPSFDFNIGKHFALSRSVFLDGYAGLGYSHSFYDGSHNVWYDSYNDHYYEEPLFADGMWAAGYRGLRLNFGLRFSVLWSR